MSSKTYRLCSLVMTIMLGAFIAWSIAMEMPVFVPIVGITVVLLLRMLCRRYTRDIMVDERVKTIDEKAATVSYRIFCIVMAILSPRIFGSMSATRC